MCWRSLSCGSLVVLAGMLVALSVAAEKAGPREQDEQAIRTTAKAYVAALEKGDAKALAEFWTTDGDFIDDSGIVHPVGELAAKAEPTAGQAPLPKMKVTASKIRFLTDDVAIEDGASEVELPDAKPGVRGHYHAVWVKQAGRWRLASLCEMPIASPVDARLADMGWMVGNWSAEYKGTRLEVNVHWNATETFLLREFKAMENDKVVLRGSQRMGWDPLTGKLKSWNFDSDGGYDEATWTKDGDAWVGQATGVLPDGRQTSATIVVTYDGKDTYLRQTLAGRVQGEPTSDQKVRFTRQADPQR